MFLNNWIEILKACSDGKWSTFLAFICTQTARVPTEQTLAVSSPAQTRRQRLQECVRVCFRPPFSSARDWTRRKLWFFPLFPSSKASNRVFLSAIALHHPVIYTEHTVWWRVCCLVTNKWHHPGNKWNYLMCANTASALSEIIIYDMESFPAIVLSVSLVLSHRCCCFSQSSPSPVCSSKNAAISPEHWCLTCWRKLFSHTCFEVVIVIPLWQLGELWKVSALLYLTTFGVQRLFCHCSV